MRRLGWAMSLGGLVLAGALGACSSPPPPPEPPPRPTAEPEPEPPPPPPKCEAMSEKCAASADTKARIPGTDRVFTPPPKWLYAQLEEATVAQQSDNGAVLALTTFVADKQPQKLGAQRSDLIAQLAELVGLTPPAKKVPLFRADQTDDVAGLRMSFWEKAGASRGSSKGAMLVVSAEVESKTLFGIGFAPADDKEASEDILEALQTLTKGSSPPDGSHKDKGGSK